MTEHYSIFSDCGSTFLSDRGVFQTNFLSIEIKILNEMFIALKQPKQINIKFLCIKNDFSLGRHIKLIALNKNSH